jgi:peptidyl-prolyl cis-trans isomerase A (cyclophilin A)
MRRKILPTVVIHLLLFACVSTAYADRTLVKLTTNYGAITIQLYDTETPRTTANFLKYVNRGFYDGIIFHRVVPNFVIQAGIYTEALYDLNFADDPNLLDPAVYRKPDAPIKDEIVSTLKNTRGAVAMALSGPNTGTSQFYINQKANTSLDGTYTVFGGVVAGLTVVDTIDALTTITDPNVTIQGLANLPVAPVVIENAEVIQTFDPNSSDFSDVDFLKAKPGDVRTFIGHGTLKTSKFRHEFTETTLLGVKCLKWLQTASTNNEVGSVSVYLARDKAGLVWVFKYVLNEGTTNEIVVFTAADLLSIRTVDSFASRGMIFRLISGGYNPDNLADPNNTVSQGSGATLETEKILSVTASLPPAYPDANLISTKWTLGPVADPNDIRWRYYHPNLGLVVDLWNDTQDVNGDGWFLAEPIEKLAVTLKAGQTRSPAEDSFKVTGTAPLAEADFESGDLFFNIGPYSVTLNTDAFKLSSGHATFNGMPGDGSYLAMNFNLKNGKFVITGQKLSLTGLAAPVGVTLRVGNVNFSDTATVKNSDGVPILYSQGNTDVLRYKTYRYVSRSSSLDPSYLINSLDLWGFIATKQYPINLTQMKTTIGWGTDTYTISLGDLVKQGNKEKYLYRSSASLNMALFDLSKGTFQIKIQKSSLSGPTKSLSVKFEDSTGTAVYNKTVSVTAP